jgi:hypothetical protein
MILYCKTALKQKVKVGDLFQDLNTGECVFEKNRAHLMRVIGPNGGYGIQKELLTDANKKVDILSIFQKNPNIKVLIKDVDTMKVWTSTAADWLEHQHKGNYGDGKQVFLATDYMQLQGGELWR